MNLAEKIRYLRKAKGLSQEELGNSLSRVKKYGISRQTISDWENGKFEPVLENIRDLAIVLDVSFDVLLDDSIDLNSSNVVEFEDTKTITSNECAFIFRRYGVTLKLFTPIICSIIILIFTVIVIIITLVCKFYILWIAAAVLLIVFCLSIVNSIFALIAIKNGNPTCNLGYLSCDKIVIYNYHNLVIPFKDIISFKLIEPIYKKHSSIEVVAKNFDEPLIIYDVLNSKKLVDIYNKIMNNELDEHQSFLEQK